MAMEWLSDAMPYLMAVIFIYMIVKFIKDEWEKRRKPKMVEIPRDTNERLEKAIKKSFRAGMNKHRRYYRLYVTGDAITGEYRMGDIIALQPTNEMYYGYIKQRWWKFWKKPEPIALDPEFTSDLNLRDVVAEVRGVDAVAEGINNLIPRYGTQAIEEGDIQRAINRQTRINKLFMHDLQEDTAIIPKHAIRGDMAFAHREIGRYDEMPEIEEEKLKKRQKKMYNDQTLGEGGNQ